MHATEIVAYTFNADIYCPGCIEEMLPTDEGEAYDGWAMAPGAGLSTTVEENLSEIAYAFGIDRGDERTFDSSEFPKVVFACQLDEYAVNICGGCFGMLD